MFVLFTTILGFLSSALPNILRYFENKQKMRHELQMATLKLEAAVRNVELMKDMKEIDAYLADTKSAREHDSEVEGSKIIEFLRSSVRPIITYSFVGLYFAVKIMAIIVLLNHGLTIDNIDVATKIILDETTISIIGLVIGFYFGSRSMFTGRDKP
jgi:hypothetical protein